MKTPIYDFVQNYIQSNTARFHMPGHKGKPFLGCEPMDITEIGGADVLYSPDGIIAQSEANATRMFDTAHTFYSTEGSSLAIRAMLALVRGEGEDDKPVVLASRNAHKAFVYACALLDYRVEWLTPTPEETDHVCKAIVTPKVLANKLASMRQGPAAVYVTSPDYLGHIADIAGLSAICKQYEIPLLVDNAHGAYLRFLEPSLHPITLGATACCDSAHKTLPVLTGGAYLHISQDAPKEYVRQARKYLSLFASTSPSYLILQSLDLCNAYIEQDCKKCLSETVLRVAKTKERIKQLGFYLVDGEAMKIVIRARASGFTGGELGQKLREFHIECEMADPDYLVLMISAQNDPSDLERLINALSAIKPRPPLDTPSVLLPPMQVILSPREAILSPSETVCTDSAAGRICASPCVSCPPAVPIVMSGEMISQKHIELMKYYGYDRIEVVK
jgi:arginine/lysine/ornithine decarboxylase